MRDRDSPERRSAHNGSLRGSEAVERARELLHALTGRECEAVSSLTRNGEGWRVRVEVVELERIPQSTDILASYEIELDGDGELSNYERVARYYRNAASTVEE